MPVNNTGEVLSKVPKPSPTKITISPKPPPKICGILRLKPKVIHNVVRSGCHGGHKTINNKRR